MSTIVAHMFFLVSSKEQRLKAVHVQPELVIKYLMKIKHIELKSWHTLFYKGNGAKKINGVGYIRAVILIKLQIMQQYKCTVIQVYGPTSDHEDEEIEALYEELYEEINL